MSASPGLPAGLSAAYWSAWNLPRGASVAESLGEGEAWMGGWDDVGLYEGNNKIPSYQTTTIHITTHRLLVLPDTGMALQAPLSAVRQSEFYSGFMRSSPKITLMLGRTPVPPPDSKQASTSTSPMAATAPATPAPEPEEEQAATWTCGVCGFANPTPPGGVVGSSKCQLCGVAYAMSKSMSAPPTRAATPAAPPRSATPASTVSVPAPGLSAPAPESPVESSGSIACPACTFLNHASMARCEMCGTALRRAPVRASTVGAEKHDTVRLSFHKGGVKEAYARLKGVLSDKVWERVDATPRRSDGEDGRVGGGIDAIMKNISLDNKAKDSHMQDAFRDLEVLMVRAGEMVRLAQSLNAKLSATSAPSDEEATLVRSSLVRLGLPAPALTQDMVRDERQYLDGLARELGGLLTGRPGAAALGTGLMLKSGNGVIGLDTVWGLWMRARGVALLPPAVLARLLHLLPLHTQPAVRAMTLPSGLRVLYAPTYAPATLGARLVRRMEQPSEDGELVSMSIIEIAATEGLPIGLASELVDMVAASPGKGEVGLARDDQAGPSAGGTRWFADVIAGWPLGTVA